AIPAEARIWDCKGLTIYAGFIESYFPIGQTNSPATANDDNSATANLTAGGVNFYGVPGQRSDPGARGASYEVGKISPEHRAVQDYSPNSKTIKPLRDLGFTAAVIAPQRGII